MASIIHKELSDNVLGPGLLESAYEGAICMELKHLGLSVERQPVFPLSYRGEYIGAHVADLVVAGTIILELKVVKALLPVMDRGRSRSIAFGKLHMEAQIINYLKLSRLPVGYLLNFANTRVEWKRFVNQRE